MPKNPQTGQTPSPEGIEDEKQKPLFLKKSQVAIWKGFSGVEAMFRGEEEEIHLIVALERTSISQVCDLLFHAQIPMETIRSFLGQVLLHDRHIHPVHPMANVIKCLTTGSLIPGSEWEMVEAAAYSNSSDQYWYQSVIWFRKAIEDRNGSTLDLALFVLAESAPDFGEHRKYQTKVLRQLLERLVANE